MPVQERRAKCPPQTPPIPTPNHHRPSRTSVQELFVHGNHGAVLRGVPDAVAVGALVKGTDLGDGPGVDGLADLGIVAESPHLPVRGDRRGGGEVGPRAGWQRVGGRLHPCLARGRQDLLGSPSPPRCPPLLPRTPHAHKQPAACTQATHGHKPLVQAAGGVAQLHLLLHARGQQAGAVGAAGHGGAQRAQRAARPALVVAPVGVAALVARVQDVVVVDVAHCGERGSGAGSWGEEGPPGRSGRGRGQPRLAMPPAHCPVNHPIPPFPRQRPVGLPTPPHSPLSPVLLRPQPPLAAPVSSMTARIFMHLLSVLLTKLPPHTSTARS